MFSTTHGCNQEKHLKNALTVHLEVLQNGVFFLCA